MKLPDALGQFLNKKPATRDVLVSLYLDVHSVSAAVWSLGPQGLPHILVSETYVFARDSWEDRTNAVDRVLGILEDKAPDVELHRVILGLPAAYLTDAGEIKKEVRSEIKELLTELELSAVGFVPLHQALVYKMKKDEGVPPSVILLGINSHTLTISIYKVGTPVGIRVLDKHQDIARTIEEGLKSFTDLEVLPARMLLFGSEAKELDGMRSDLLKHPWPTKVNFLHFPKIEIVTPEFIVDAISLAGASELGNSVESGAEESEPESTSVTPPVYRDKLRTVAAQEAYAKTKAAEEEIVEDEVLAAQEAIEEDLGEPPEMKQDANVVMVDSSSLGFRKDADILEHPEAAHHAPVAVVRDEEVKDEEIEDEEDAYEEEDGKRFSFASMLAGIRFPANPFTRLPGRGVALIIGIVALVLFGTGFFLYWALPHATVTLFEVPKDIEESMNITIDPTATVVDGEEKIVPGIGQEQSVSGEKTVPVKGKKNIGDPARGTVTVYNKTLSEKSFKKGSALTNGALQFTLDGDVKVASANENIGSVTYGKVDVQITAKEIGPQSNLSAGKEFSFVDISDSTAIARNERALSGGTSKFVTVVTRDDEDTLVEALSDELIAKAKADLKNSVTGNATLIDDTVKTSITEKVFNKEIDQEAVELQGKVTLVITGIAVRESDLEALFSSILSSNLPPGYKLTEGKTSVALADIQVKKDGKITAMATMKSIALPSLDTAQVQKQLAGKTIQDAEQLLRAMPGVGAVGVGFRFSPTKSRMPINAKNISVSIEIQ